MTREKPKYCHCSETCNKLLSQRQRDRHYAKLTLSELQTRDCPVSPYNSGLEPDINDEERPANIQVAHSEGYSGGSGSDSDEGDDLQEVGNTSRSYSDVEMLVEDEDGMDISGSPVQPKSDDDSEIDIEPEISAEDDWLLYCEDEELDAEEEYALFEKILDSEDGLAKEYEELTAKELDDIQTFKLYMFGKMPRLAFEQMRYAFRHRMDISSLYVIAHKLAIMSGIVPEWYDCCIKSCVAYIGELEGCDSCPECSQPRWIAQTTKPRRLFCYVPLIPRLQKFFANPKSRAEILYRHERQPPDNCISDVFDGEHYKNLCKTRVVVDGEGLSHRFFSDKRDIAFSTCLDSYLLYKRRRGGPSAMPIVVQIYNLKPEIRTHLSRLVCLGVIPGPKAPKRLSTFLIPLDGECASLAKGVDTYDCNTRMYFPLHAYNLFPQGDMVAIEKFLGINGHNGFSPCRSCEIKGINDSSGSGDTTYYVPLMHVGGTQEWDPLELPKHRHEDWITITSQIQNAEKKKDKRALAFHHGIKGMPGLIRVNSLNYARGVPLDFMHLLYENVVQNLVHLWMGKFKGLKEGVCQYVIPEHIWMEIGIETVAAVRNIPAAFVRALGNIAENRSHFTAEGWAFWFIYLAPILLKTWLHDRPYKHMIQLVDIMKTCIQFSLTLDEVDELETDIISWVREYEKIYYQYNGSRLSTCTLTIHGLLHICDNIRYCGPVWTTWTFWMERYCGYLQSGLRSRTHPWANLNNRILHKAYLDQIEVIYDLAVHGINPPREVLGEVVSTEYNMTYLRRPCRKDYQPDTMLRNKIARYFKQILPGNKSAKKIKKALPMIMPSWSKVRIAHGGDNIWSTSASYNSEKERNMSYFRYEILVLDADDNLVRTIFYGRLERILECQLNDDTVWEGYKEKKCLLAVITPCVTHGLDATQVLTFYSRTTTAVVTDLRAIQCVIGRVKVRNDWGIIDRSDKLVRTEFISTESESESGDE